LQAVCDKVISAASRRTQAKGDQALLKLLSLIAAGVALAAFVPSFAKAGGPVHESFSGPVTFPNPCGFPIVSELVGTNDVATFFDGEGNVTRLQLHQSVVGILSANDTTLRVNTEEQIFVDFAAGTVKEVGVLDSIFGPNGRIFFRTGLSLTELASGAIIARHGVLDILDPVEFCAVFS
jgi:hypothetical protein